MRLKRIKIEGYRSLKSVEWKPAPLNVLIGPNASGKSNLLRALELLPAAARGELNEAVLSRGGMAPLVWDGASPGISYTLVMGSTSSPGSLERALEYKLGLFRLGESGAFEIRSEQVDETEGATLKRHMDRKNPKEVSFFDGGGKLVQTYDDVRPSEAALALAAPLPGNELVTSLRQQLRSYAVYHDLRVDAGAPVRQSAVARMETRLDPDGQNLVPVLNTLYERDRAFEGQIDAAMTAAFPKPYDKLTFPSSPEHGRIQLQVRWQKGSHAPSTTDLSDGTLRFLMLLAILGSPDSAPLIAIDEPELGLHPDMLPVVAEFAADVSTRSHVILSTHSPEMLDAFDETLPATTVFSWVDDHTEMRTLEGSQLEKWVEDYSLGRFCFSGEAEAVS